MILFDLLKVSVKNIWSHKMRSGLTILGLVIGIMAVVLITTLGNGAKADIDVAFKEKGEGKLSISVRSTEEEEALYRDYFTQEDVSGIGGAYQIEGASAVISRRVTAKYKQETISFYLYGVDSNYDQVDGLKLVAGRFLSAADVAGRRNTVVIDEKTAEMFFGTVDCIGEVFTVTRDYQTVELMVVGVDKLTDSTIVNMANGTYYYGYSPITVVSRLYALDRYPRIRVQAERLADMNQIEDRLLSLLVRRNKNPEKVGIYLDQTEFSQINSIIGILTGMVAAIAGISLIVGGIGIMNMMLVSVTERTREIGIRKAIGAKSSMILLQFLFEAVFLSILGGGIGLGLGSGLGWLIVTVLGLPFLLSPQAIWLALVFSVGVGIFFGVYPARKAARLHPIDALRYE